MNNPRKNPGCSPLPALGRKLAWALWAVSLGAHAAPPATQDKELTAKPVQFAPGKSSTVIKGRITGDNTVDYQLRAAAGQPLKPVSAKVDAVIPGTPYHAQTTTLCTPAYSQARECEARVIRRGFDGTATVELRWGDNGMRRILFVKGEPKAADAMQPMTFTRNERGWSAKFGDDEHFEIPDGLVFGG